MSGIVNKIIVLLGLAVSRKPTQPPISRLSFTICPADTSTVPVDSSKKININPNESADKKMRKAHQRAKGISKKARMMPTTSSAYIQTSKWTASQLLQLFDHGPSCQKDSDWSGVVEGKSANASKQTWGRAVSKAMRAALRDRGKKVKKHVEDERSKC